MSISCFNLTGVCWTVCGLTYTTCSTVHIHSFHKKYIFVYTAFTLSYNRAVTGTSGCFWICDEGILSRSATMRRVQRSCVGALLLELTHLGYLAVSLYSLLLLSCLFVWFVGGGVCAASPSLWGGRQQTRSPPLLSQTRSPLLSSPHLQPSPQPL